VIIAPTALKMLKAVTDRRVKGILARSIDELEVEPGKKGKPLIGPLKGYRSLRSVGQRYRIIYQVKDNVVEVLVVAVGLRKEGDKNDIYLLMKKLIHHKLME
jgi:mRNA interferase RelE/StbE